MSELKALLDIVRSGDYLVLDTETTGLDSTSEIVSIAIIASDGRPLLNTLCHPTRPIPPEATNIHGITNEMVKNILPFPSELVQAIVQDKHVIIYNANYDVTMLYRSTQWAGMPFVEWGNLAQWHCAMESFAEVFGEVNTKYGGYKWQKLSRGYWCAHGS